MHKKKKALTRKSELLPQNSQERHIKLEKYDSKSVTEKRNALKDFLTGHFYIKLETLDPCSELIVTQSSKLQSQ